MAKEATNKILVLNDGREFKITGETGKYWICKNAQFRKSNPAILDVIEKEPAKKKKAKEETVEEVKVNEEFDEGFEMIPDISDLDIPEIEEDVQKGE